MISFQQFVQARWLEKNAPLILIGGSVPKTGASVPGPFFGQFFGRFFGDYFGSV